MAKTNYDYTIWGCIILFGPLVCIIFDINFLVLIGVVILLYIINYLLKSAKKKKTDKKVRNSLEISLIEWNTANSYKKDKYRRDFELKTQRLKREDLTRKAFGIKKETWNSYSREKKYEFEKPHREELQILKQAFFTKFYNGRAISSSEHKRINNRVEIAVSQASKELYKLSTQDRIERIEDYKQIIEGNLKHWDKIKQEKVEKVKNKHINYEKFGNNLLKYVAIGLITLTIVTCSSRKRIGARCKDGSYSSSTSIGTCSHHNGVSSWKYKYWWE